MTPHPVLHPIHGRTHIVETVRYRSPCPTCGRDAVWEAQRAETRKAAGEIHVYRDRLAALLVHCQCTKGED